LRRAGRSPTLPFPMTDLSSLAQRRHRVAGALPLGDAVLVIGAGLPVPLPENSDQSYPFRSHAEYYYLAGRECAGGVLGFDPRDAAAAGGGWVDFEPPVTEEQRVWEGRCPAVGLPLSELQPWLEARRHRPLIQLGAPVAGVVSDPTTVEPIRDALTHARRVKDAAEIALLRRAAAATARGYARACEVLRPGHTERSLQIELEAEFFRGGGSTTGYATIIGSGPNAAVLHFSPSGRVIGPGEFVLIDAGAEVERYTADVTRTYVTGTPTPFQHDLYQAVLQAQDRAISRCVAGAEWKDIHLATAVDLVAGLVAMGVMRGAPESLVEQDAHTLFFPHGLGHMVGLGVRDAGGLAPGRRKDARASLRSLRMDLPLLPGYVVTVEPGLYFIPLLLNQPERRARYRDAVNWPVVDANLQLGGVRIEDNVLVTAGAPDVLTRAIPKTLAPR
jgi:Xaa-Pro aminopeptidase